LFAASSEVKTGSTSVGGVDRFLAFGGLVLAGLLVVSGLLAMVSDVFGWFAVGLSVVGLVGLLILSVRFLLAHEWAGGSGWMVSSWVVVVVAFAALAMVATGSRGWYDLADFEYLATSGDIVVPAVGFGLAVGLAAVGLLRTSVRAMTKTVRLMRMALITVGVLVLGWGLVGWFSPASVQDLRANTDTEVRQFQDGTAIVWDSPEHLMVEAEGYEGKEPPAGWDEWNVISFTSTPRLRSVPLDEAVQYVADNDENVLFVGTEDELNTWLEDEGSAYKVYSVPVLLIVVGAVLVVSALTLAPRPRQVEPTSQSERTAVASNV
jgi:hypothetical protein